MTHQPQWEIIAAFGDVDFLNHGGTLVFRDKTGVYDPEIETYDPETGEVHRAECPRLKKLSPSHPTNLIPYDWDETWRFSAYYYVEWFSDHIKGAADTTGQTVQSLVDGLTSEDDIVRCQAYDLLAGALGWENFDQYPLRLSRRQAAQRYNFWLARLKKGERHV